MVPLLVQVSIAGAQIDPLPAPVPYAHLREADVMWMKRVWRRIDLKEKLNHPLFYPIEPADDRRSLFDVIRSALLNEGLITAYDAALGDGDEFTRPLSRSELERLLDRSDTIQTEDPDTGEMIDMVIDQQITSGDIVAYTIKEDHIFDRQRSVMDIRIIGIAPVIAVMGSDGELRGVRTLFWLYYPECRYVFAQSEAFNRHNDAERLSFDALFRKRQFSSTVTKWSNVYDREITDHAMGLDALLQGEAIEEELFEFEHDLWHH